MWREDGGGCGALLDRLRSRAGPLVGGRGRRGVRGGRAVEWCGGVTCYLAVHYEDVARKTQGN